MKEEHRVKHLQFVEEYVDKTPLWGHTFFVDKRKINFDGSNRFAYYWHDICQDDKIFSTSQIGGGNVLVWGAFSALGKAYILFCKNTLNSVENYDILESKLLHEAHDLFGHEAFHFVHDIHLFIHQA